jgi:hypothetical protein
MTMSPSRFRDDLRKRFIFPSARKRSIKISGESSARADAIAVKT